MGIGSPQYGVVKTVLAKGIKIKRNQKKQTGHDRSSIKNGSSRSISSRSNGHCDLLGERMVGRLNVGLHFPRFIAQS